MCMPDPGPRCSFHAHKEYASAVSKLAQATDPEQIEKLSARVEEKRSIYYTTPRGQNYLRRNVMFAETPEDKEKYGKMLYEAAQTRDSQIEAYKSLKLRMSTRVDTIKNNDQLSSKLKRSSIALKSFLEWFNDPTAHIHDDSESIVTDFGRFLIVGNKYTLQGIKATDIPEGVLGKLAQGTWNEITENETQLTEWVYSELKKKEYSGIALVNYMTGDVKFISTDSIDDSLTFKVKPKSIPTGTTKWLRPISEAEEKLKHLNIKNLKLHKDAKLGTMLTTTEPLLQKQRTISNIHLTLANKQPAESDTFLYIVRRKGESSSTKLAIEMRPKHKTFSSSIAEEWADQITFTGQQDDENATITGQEG